MTGTRGYNAANNSLKAARVITAMSRGVTLHLTFTRCGSDFTLSNGTRVDPKVAMAVVDDARIMSANDGLFPAISQTWRYVER